MKRNPSPPGLRFEDGDHFEKGRLWVPVDVERERHEVDVRRVVKVPEPGKFIGKAPRFAAAKRGEGKGKETEKTRVGWAMRK